MATSVAGMPVGGPPQGPYGFASRKKASGPDRVLAAEQLQALQDMYKKFGHVIFCAQMLWILRKNPEPGEKDILKKTAAWNKRLVPFVYNRIQRDMQAKRKNRNVWLKPRQAGYTTKLLLDLLLYAILEPGSGNCLISQNSQMLAQHFGMLQRAYKYFGVVDPYKPSANVFANQLHENLLHTAYSNRKELVFDITDSKIICQSAEVEEAGQGLTIQHLHASEVARWSGKPEETLANIKEAIPFDGTIDEESTANGMGGYFWEEYNRAKEGEAAGEETEFKAHFHEWWWHDEYRADRDAKVTSLTQEEQLLVEKVQLDLKQILWRRKKIVSLRHNFKEKYPESDVDCFLLQGSGYFDNEILGQRLMELKGYQPYDKFKKLVIFKPRVKGRRYVIGADVAEGKLIRTDDPDWSAAIVQDIETGEVMARYLSRLAPEVYAMELADLGKLYNNAHIAVERNNHGGACILALEVMAGYGNLYKHKEWFKRERKVIEVLGFPTTVKTRPVALNRAKFLVEQSPELVYDTELIKQCMTFVLNEKGKPAAQDGCHDDLVSALWISQYARLVMLGYIDPVAMKSEKYGETEEFTEYTGDEEE